MLHMFAMRVCLARNRELFRLDLALQMEEIKLRKGEQGRDIIPVESILPM